MCSQYVLAQWHRFLQKTILANLFVNALGMQHKLLRYGTWKMLKLNPSNLLIFGEQDGNCCLISGSWNYHTVMSNLNGTGRTGSRVAALPSPSKTFLPPDIQVKVGENWPADNNRDCRLTLQKFSVLFSEQTRFQIFSYADFTSVQIFFPLPSRDFY